MTALFKVVPGPALICENEGIEEDCVDTNCQLTKNKPDCTGNCVDSSKLLQTVMSVPKFALSMSGCGFLCTYHLGSAQCFQQHSPTLLRNIHKFAGASAGALVAALVSTCPDKIPTALGKLYDLADETNKLQFGALTSGFSIMDRLEQIIDESLPANAHEIASQKLVISITRVADKTNKLVDKFEDRQSLIRHLMASSYIPVYGAPNKTPVIDGEVNLLNIVRGAQALFPPDRETLEEYYRHGYKDTMRFLIEQNLWETKCGTEV